MANVREIPAGSGINGRPILDHDPDTRHIAYHRDGVWFTWCGERVPEDHMCPSEREQQARQRHRGPLRNCTDCHDRYLRGDPASVTASGD
ncbi:hypothetical protein [Prauserella endophytica]|uniref:Uncharacterized protein n=1 Tax=Prauserella endophytica TaxID=1592324 RepID=A0ABY2RW81_9PSEU|nr:hypothetical protein [Prauserella endophytica]TKG63096.1 hypothetical protein FCN18_30460 [Prauserella endophytica]